VKLAAVNGIELEYDDRGAGDPIVFIHGALVADAFGPLVNEPALAGFRMILYRRRGYGGSTPPRGSVSIQDQASDCRALLRRLDIERAHVVGHSFAGCVALQLAADFPAVVRSLTLLEPSLMIGDTAASYRASLAAATERYRSDGAAAVIDAFIEARWPGYREPLERVLPGAFADAVRDAAATFECDLPAQLDWTFDERDLRRITQPVLAVLGGDSNAMWSRFGEVHDLMLQTLPRAQGLTVPDSTHMMQVQQPAALAEAIAAFCARQASA
jgi:3-oxoadipate enol-lactonase